MAGRVGYERLSKDRSLRGINVAIQHAEIDEFAEDSGELIKKHFCDNDTKDADYTALPLRSGRVRQ
jgi:hypothetical protein